METKQYKKAYLTLLGNCSKSDWGGFQSEKISTIDDVKCLFSHNEGVIGLEILCENIYEYNVIISIETYKLVEEIAIYLNSYGSNVEYKYIESLVVAK
ncbi:MafI family immunity protein [Teredinibacter franksiae]|uniref:MafI family immunity protein n=1 Tax=Teredinibacter franksiae TaxID=2761453 RepID=UPI001625EA0C